MSKKHPTVVRAKGTGKTLGLGAFEKISAVEGIRLTAEMKRDVQGFDTKRMTAGERTRFITGKYGKKSA